MKIKIDRSFQFIDNHSGSKKDPKVGIVDPHDTVVVKIQDSKGNWVRTGLSAGEFVTNTGWYEFEKELNTPEKRLALLGRVTGLRTDSLDSFKIFALTYDRLPFRRFQDWDHGRGHHGRVFGLFTSDGREKQLQFGPLSYEGTGNCHEKEDSSFKWTDTSILSVGLFLAAPFYGIGGAILGGHALHRILVSDEDKTPLKSPCNASNAKNPVDGYGP